MSRVLRGGKGSKHPHIFKYIAQRRCPHPAENLMPASLLGDAADYAPDAYHEYPAHRSMRVAMHVTP